GGVGHAVGAADVVPGREGGIGLEGGVGAAGMNSPRGPRDEAAVAADPGADRDHGRMARVAGREVLRVADQQPHRPPRLAREEVGDGQVHGVALAPEVAAPVDDVYSMRSSGTPIALASCTRARKGALLALHTWMRSSSSTATRQP